MYHQTAQSVGTGSGRQKHHDFPGRTWTSSVTLSTTHQMKGKGGLCIIETTTSAVSARKDGSGEVIALKATNKAVLNCPHLSSSVSIFGPWTEISAKHKINTGMLIVFGASLSVCPQIQITVTETRQNLRLRSETIPRASVRFSWQDRIHFCNETNVALPSFGYFSSHPQNITRIKKTAQN